VTRASARIAALRTLAARRLTEAQLWSRLARKDFTDDEIRDAVAWCKVERYLDDPLFARLYVDGRSKAVGDARLIGELVLRGIDREAASATVARSERTEDVRLAAALEKIFVARPGATYASVARRLERLGFPAAAIYRHLRGHASRFSDRHAPSEDSAIGAE
jgi:SOS response regulatory protein OraA/RecX